VGYKGGIAAAQAYPYKGYVIMKNAAFILNYI
jgi:hypothetical protein